MSLMLPSYISKVFGRPVSKNDTTEVLSNYQAIVERTPRKYFFGRSNNDRDKNLSKRLYTAYS